MVSEPGNNQPKYVSFVLDEWRFQVRCKTKTIKEYKTKTLVKCNKSVKYFSTCFSGEKEYFKPKF